MDDCMRRTVIVVSLLISVSSDWAVAQRQQAVNEEIPHAVRVARATTIPVCSVHVDASALPGGNGSAARPHKTISAAVQASAGGAVICVAEGVYQEEIKPGDKPFTLAGGFQGGSGFAVRDSAKYVSHAKGNGTGSFLRIVDPGPKGGLTAVDGFEVSGYSQAIVRAHWESQRFDITNNYIHDNTCTDQSLWGAGFSVNNVSGSIKGNVIARNSCGRGGAGAINDETNQNTVTIEGNLIDGNSGTEPSSAHGGGLHVGANKLKIVGNLIINNTVTLWGGGLYVGAYNPGNQPTTATLAWNIYRGNKAGDSGGGFFCDDGAKCIAEHEVYDRNCGGNVLVDGASEGGGATQATFKNITVVGALNETCDAPGIGFWMDTYDAYAPDTYAISNAIFWDNAEGQDLRATCGHRCAQLKLRIDNSMIGAKNREEGVKITYGANILPSADPMFVAREDGNYRLQPGSPAVGKGSGGTHLGAYGVGKGEAGSARQTAPSGSPARVTVEPPATPVTDRSMASPNSAPASPAAGERKAPVATPSPAAVAGEVSAKEAFAAAKELGTPEAWSAFLTSYPTGFYADLARAYMQKLGAAARSPAASAPPAAPPATQIPAPKPAPAAAPGPAPKSAPSASARADDPAAADPAKAAVTRGGDYMGFAERFNRYYTDPSWRPSSQVFVSPSGGGDGTSRANPASVEAALAAAKPGMQITFLAGTYQGGYQLTKERSGTYDQPIVLFAERNADGSLGVKMTCNKGTRQTCFNLEAADYIAVDGFEMSGGRYGVRSVGVGFAASEHARGIAVLNNRVHDQDRDPFFSGQSDWAVWERNIGYGAKKGDGHAIYISNGSDWNIVRFNQTYGGASSDFQINADPTSTCKEVGIAFDDARCDAYAGEGEGGQGASDYFLVDSNFFHHSNGPGANFTSVRRSIVRNNIFGPHGDRHNTSFWQETDNPKLGSADNKILHNLFITTQRHAVQFKAHSTRNEFANNVIVGMRLQSGRAAANPSALLMEVDETVGENVYRNNLYTTGRLEGREPGDQEISQQEFSPDWFRKFPSGLAFDPSDFSPSSSAPFLGAGTYSPDAPLDFNAFPRSGQVDLGPIEAP
jgi:hypothetical protein